MFSSERWVRYFRESPRIGVTIALTTVRDATFEIAAELGMTTWFGNPGSTEIPLLADFPDLTRVLPGATCGAGQDWTSSRAGASPIVLPVSLGRWEEFEMHLRGARDELTTEQIGELLRHTAVYCGVPLANAAFDHAR